MPVWQVFWDIAVDCSGSAIHLYYSLQFARSRRLSTATNSHSFTYFSVLPLIFGPFLWVSECAGTDIGSWWEDRAFGGQDRDLTITGSYSVVMCILCGKYPGLILTDNFIFWLNFLQADSFHRHGRELRRKMWLQNLRFKLMVGGAIAVLILILWLMVCRGFKC
jgi:hypothetical protein